MKMAIMGLRIPLLEVGSTLSFIDMLDALNYFMPHRPPRTDQSIPPSILEYADCHVPVASQIHQTLLWQSYAQGIIDQALDNLHKLGHDERLPSLI